MKISLTADQLKLRDSMVPIAVMEHHQLAQMSLGVHDIAERLVLAWLRLEAQTKLSPLLLTVESVLLVNNIIAESLELPGAGFRGAEKWEELIEQVADELDDDPAHVCSWMFSALYWEHLERCRGATAFFYLNLIRSQHGLPPYTISLKKLGAFLDSLSASGPPLYDGQTFYPEEYSD
jgi:hypothetical protein